MKPKRIQLKRTKGWKLPPNTVKVDRTTKFGNPYKVGRVLDAEGAVKFFAHYMSQNEMFVKMVRHELAGKNLACWCKPGSPCHADILLAVANQIESAEVVNIPKPILDKIVRDDDLFCITKLTSEPLTYQAFFSGSKKNSLTFAAGESIESALERLAQRCVEEKP